MKKMKFYWIAIVVLLTAFTGVAQDQRVLMTIEDVDVSVDEFLSIYNKNNTANVVDKKSMEEYLDLFLNFKLKVQAAEELGMDTASKFMTELAGYRRQLAQPYLVDRQMNDQLMREAYDRMQQDVAAYHILVKLEESATGPDTVAALKKLKSLSKDIRSEDDMRRVMDRVRSGSDREVIAEDLGYFTAFSMVYPFETAAYLTEVGKLSEPVRTRFGYHVIFVTDKRPARGEIKVSHIMVKTSADMSAEDQQLAKEKVDAIYNRLQAGEDFSTLAQEYSDDKSTARNGGGLPWFGTGRMVQAFEDAAFSIDQDGSFSAPIQTSYGWHIIQREQYKGIASFDELKSSIKKRIERDSRGQKGRLSLLKKLKEDYAISYNLKLRSAVEKGVTSDYLEGKWSPQDPNDLSGVVMVIKDDRYSKSVRECTQLEYFEYLKKYQRKYLAEQSLKEVMDLQWNGFVNACLIDFENSILEFKHADFKALMQEYHDGILLFDLMDQKVWSKSVSDTAGLEAFYDAHQDQYMWPERVDASIYLCENEQIEKQTLKLAKKRVKKGYADNTITSMVNEENALSLAIRSGLYAKGDEEYLDQVSWAPGITTLSSASGKRVIVQIYSVMAPSPKSLAECRGLVTSDYQAHLEQAWIKELRSKYAYNIDMEVFQSIESK